MKIKHLWKLATGVALLSLTACVAKPIEAPDESFGLDISVEQPASVESTEVSSTEAESSETTVEEYNEHFRFTRNNMPRLDGSTSTVPLAVAACAELLGEAPEDVEELIQFNKTTTAYLNLLNGDADILIVGESNQEVLDRKQELGFEWEKKPFATDAFIFVVNEDNPVDSITIEQARKIYTGEITNWKELGGNDLEIVALQRNQGAGSQTLMEKHIMKGEAMMEAPKEYLIASMGELMEAVKSYDGTAGAIGYSVYYYAEEMKMAQGLKMLKLEGVEPTPETIRNETYPIINPKYVVIPADAGINSPNRRMYEWLLSEEGQTLIAKEGYVSIMDVGTYPKTAPTVGTRLREGYMDSLTPSANYGALTPYVGRRLSDSWPASTGCMYGLMTTDGMAVTDAVYSGIYYLMCYGKAERPLFQLIKGAPDGENWATREIWVASYDGSFVTENSYKLVCDTAEGVLLYSDDSLTVMNPDGAIREVLTKARLGMSDQEWSWMIAEASFEQMVAGCWFHDSIGLLYKDGTALVYNLAKGEVVTLTDDEWWELHYYPETADIKIDEDRVYAYVDEAARFSENPLYLLCKSEYNDQTGHSTGRYYKADGTPVPNGIIRHGDNDNVYPSVNLRNGIIEVIELNTATYYSYETMECIFRTYLGFEAD